METMVERVARAINGTYEQFADPTPADMARAAIEAMREPTEAMKKAGAAKLDYDDSMSPEADEFHVRVCGYIFEDMIDAALSESMKGE